MTAHQLHDRPSPARALLRRIGGKLHWLAISLWAAAFFAALLPLI